MSVEEFRKGFGEDWQLSQFWYSAEFAARLAHLMAPIVSRSDVLVFISSPTAYVGFQHAYNRKQTYLLEYDRRFELIDAEEFVHYDLEEPLRVPEHLKGRVDFAVVDPPFLNEVTSRKVAETVKELLAPKGRVLLLTGRSIADAACGIYKEVADVELKETALKVEHAGGLANAFGAWASWPDAEKFGSEGT
ncbi:hypothetical protein IE81DRAFT_294920 [Ceraceosorus guamensis]|uniref:N6-adenine methyltransferase n=1 Tax=Ceraceosorus guamensis TaxID=1522189 RepID=A0A316VT51_9BASI|nr:hypothetical protein IE81DRAFT_294920 [Ceraceosorus guamensis]PWN39391.1 hypothetical protein IE81DRAFT_294920 [Ceraceosorus guamensis]